VSACEAVIGVEIHVRLGTARKLFCADEVAFGDPPNTHVCPVCLGLPGALPVPNDEAISLAVRAALALGCTLHRRSVWARKNYFYPDLPKGYQITQFDRPLATDGRVAFDSDADGAGERYVRIRRVHMEEDAGKSLHDRIAGATAVDLNRAGTPLVEIVTEPDLRSPRDTRAFLQTLKRVLEYLDVSDCNMEEGSLRVDANVSVRPAGSRALGTKTEIKNVNSFSGIERSLELEIARQRRFLEAGESIVQQTLLWDDHRRQLRPMRSKEESHDYRYFPEPDLPPVILDEAFIARVREALPELPRVRRARLRETFGVSFYEADVLTRDRATADYFEALARCTGTPKEASNWVMGPVRQLLHETGTDAADLPVTPERLAELLTLVGEGAVSHSAARDVLRTMMSDPRPAAVIVKAVGLVQIRDLDQLSVWVDDVLREEKDAAARVRAGESKVLGFLVGRVMRRSGGAADPRRVSELIRERLGSA